MQLRNRRFQGFKNIAVVERIEQMRDHLCIRLAHEDIAFGLQCFAQTVVVFNDAVMHQSNAPCSPLFGIWPSAEVRMRVVYRRRAMRGPARVGDAGEAFKGAASSCICINLRLQLRDALRGARTL